MNESWMDEGSNLTSIQFSERELLKLEREYDTRREKEASQLIESGFFEEESESDEGAAMDSDSDSSPYFPHLGDIQRSMISLSGGETSETESEMEMKMETKTNTNTRQSQSQSRIMEAELQMENARRMALAQIYTHIRAVPWAESRAQKPQPSCNAMDCFGIDCLVSIAHMPVWFRVTAVMLVCLCLGMSVFDLNQGCGVNSVATSVCGSASLGVALSSCCNARNTDDVCLYRGVFCKIHIEPPLNTNNVNRVNQRGKSTFVDALMTGTHSSNPRLINLGAFLSVTRRRPQCYDSTEDETETMPAENTHTGTDVVLRQTDDDQRTLNGQRRVVCHYGRVTGVFELMAFRV